jgi:hypothetical protein
MRLTTPAEGRPIDVTDEVDADMGRVVYRVAGIGAFTIERDPNGYSVDPARDYALHCTYGVLTGPRLIYGRGALPEAPVMFGITIGGAAVFSPSRFTEETNRYGRPWRWSLPMQRATEHECRGSVPQRTSDRVSDIVGALTLHYLDRPDREDIEHIQAVRLAPSRLNAHTSTIARLTEQIDDLIAKRTHECALADVQAAYLAPVEETLTA